MLVQRSGKGRERSRSAAWPTPTAPPAVQTISTIRLLISFRSLVPWRWTLVQGRARRRLGGGKTSLTAPIIALER